MDITGFEVAFYPSDKSQQLFYFNPCLFASISLTHDKPLIKMIANLEKHNNTNK